MKIRLALAATSMALTALGVNAAQAQIVFADVGKNLEFQQTAPSTVVPFNGGTNGFFFGRTFYNDPADFDGGSISFSGPASPQNYNLFGIIDCCGHYGAGYQTSGYLTPADMTTNFPNGTYSLTATNSTALTSETVNVNYPGDIYTPDTPQFTAQTFNDLQHVNPAAGLTLNFNTFVPVDGTNGLGFFSIYDYTTNSYVASGPNYSDFSPSLGTLTVGPNVLVAGDSYAAELIFDDYVEGTASGTFDTLDNLGNVLTSTPVSVDDDFRSDMRTLVDFTVPSAVPEPATWAMFLLGFGAIGWTLRSRRKRPAAI